MFTNEEKAVFYILRQALFSGAGDLADENPQLPDSLNWKQVYEEMWAQAVDALVVDWVAGQSVIDADMKRMWSRLSVHTVRHWFQVMDGQEALTELLNRHQIRFAIIKGAAAAVSYPRPEYRVMGDVDFIVQPEDARSVRNLLLANGYKDLLNESAVQDCFESTHHVELVKDGVEYELHWTLPLGRQEKCVEERIPEWLRYGLAHTEVKELEGYHVTVFPWELNGLVLLRHMMQHLQENALGLRQLVDWMMFVHAHLDDAAWRDDFQKIAAEAGLEKLAIHATRACQVHLGLREEGITWCLGADLALSEELLGTLMKAGNYGEKSREEDRGLRTMMRNRSVFSFLKSLQPMGVKNWEMARKYPVLRPFAWLYQIGRDIGLVFQKSSPIRSMTQLYGKSRRFEAMLERLGIGWDSVPEKQF